MIITVITLKMAKFPCEIYQKVVPPNTKPCIVIYVINRCIQATKMSVKVYTFRLNTVIRITNWFYMPCLNKEVPFNTLTELELVKVYNGKSITYSPSHLK